MQRLWHKIQHKSLDSQVASPNCSLCIHAVHFVHHKHMSYDRTVHKQSNYFFVSQNNSAAFQKSLQCLFIIQFKGRQIEVSHFKGRANSFTVVLQMYSKWAQFNLHRRGNPCFPTACAITFTGVVTHAKGVYVLRTGPWFKQEPLCCCSPVLAWKYFRYFCGRCQNKPDTITKKDYMPQQRLLSSCCTMVRELKAFIPSNERYGLQGESQHITHSKQSS